MANLIHALQNLYLVVGFSDYTQRPDLTPTHMDNSDFIVYLYETWPVALHAKRSAQYISNQGDQNVDTYAWKL